MRVALAVPRRKRCVIVMYDSLNRHFLPPYGYDWVHAPNFERLAGHSAPVPEQLRRQHALHARPARAAHRALQLPAPQLGAAGAVRRLDAGDPGRQRRLHPPGQRPLPLLGGRRRHLSHALHHLGARPRPGRRPLEGRRRLRIRSSPGRWPEQQGLRFQRQDWINRQYMRPGRPPAPARTFSHGLEFSTATTTPTTGSCRSRPSTRTSRSSPTASTRTSTRTTTTAPTSTGRPTARSRRRPSRSSTCAANTPRCSACATPTWARSST